MFAIYGWGSKSFFSSINLNFKKGVSYYVLINESLKPLDIMMEIFNGIYEKLEYNVKSTQIGN